MRGLKDKRIVVAGGSTGIGAAKVIVGSTSTERIETTVPQITVAGGTAKGAQFDFSDAASAETLINTCIDAYGGIDGLANIGADLNHPSVTMALDLLDTPEDHWARQFDCNFTGYTRTIKAALPHMVAQRSGSSVNTSTSSAHMGETVHPAYAAAKAALHAMTRHVARRWGPDNIRCNAIAPGLVLVENIAADMPEDMRTKMPADFR